jgi:hypothetical protein
MKKSELPAFSAIKGITDKQIRADEIKIRKINLTGITLTGSTGSNCFLEIIKTSLIL